MSRPEGTRNAQSAGARLSRRTALGAAAAIFSASGLSIADRFTLAQVATPEPQGNTVAATPQTNAIGSERFPVRTALGPAVPPEYTAAETNWPSENGNLQGTRLAAGSSISRDTVDQLGLGWAFNVSISAPYGALVSAPVIAGDRLYQQDAMSNVYCLDKATGEVIWASVYNAAVPSGGPNGVGLGYGRAVYTLGGAGDVIAADAKTGEELWTTNIRGLRNEGITMAPLIYDSTVYISTIPGSLEALYQGNQRGIFVALNLDDGAVLWYLDTTTDNLWSDDGGNARVNSGGGLWHVPSVDEEGRLYVGVGNASPYPGIPGFPAGSSRPGDNDYANAVMRIDPDRAAVDWFLNVKPHDLFDLDNQLTPILTTATITGVEREVAIASGKHGYVVAIDRETGEEIWRTAVGRHQNDNLQGLPEDEYVEVYPGTFGGVETPIAHADGLIFVPVFNLASWYNATGLDRSRLDIYTATGQLVALDVATGEIVWDVEVPTGVLGAATVVNDLVFTGGLDGIVRGFRTDDGTQVFAYQTSSGLNAPFSVSGDTIYVPSGGPLFPSEAAGSSALEPQAQLIALTLGGKVPARSVTTPEPQQATPDVGSAEERTLTFG